MTAPLAKQALAELVGTARTSPRYRLHRLEGGPPLRPALERVPGCGRPIEVELWSVGAAGLGHRLRRGPRSAGGLDPRAQRRRQGTALQAGGQHHAIGLQHACGGAHTAQPGHDQSSGISFQGVPGAKPSCGSPAASSYTWSQLGQRYFMLSDLLGTVC